MVILKMVARPTRFLEAEGVFLSFYMLYIFFYYF